MKMLYDIEYWRMCRNNAVTGSAAYIRADAKINELTDEREDWRNECINSEGREFRPDSGTQDFRTW